MSALVRSLLVLAAASFALAACAPSVTDAVEPVLPDTVVDVALDNDGFDTLVAALTEAELVATLQGDGPFTVFAPTDDAFAEALDAFGITAEELLASPELGSILTYHVVAGELAATDVLAAIDAGDGTAVVTTVQGGTVEATVVDGSVVLNGTATVAATDLFAENGVVHVIDAVLLPPEE